jgi:hypothetical protein
VARALGLIFSQPEGIFRPDFKMSPRLRRGTPQRAFPTGLKIGVFPDRPPPMEGILVGDGDQFSIVAEFPM